MRLFVTSAGARAPAYVPKHRTRTAGPGGERAENAAASGVPTSLAALGLGADDLPEAAARAAAEITANPVPVDADALLGLLQRAFAGDRPEVIHRQL